jgi:hypothetical protein
LAITETYFKAPGDDIYANGPVSYLRIDELPEPGDYAPIVDVLMDGHYICDFRRSAHPLPSV